MAFCNHRPATHDEYLLSAVNALLSLKRKFGDEAVEEAIRMAEESTLQVCGRCGEWTRHKNGKCQECADFGSPPIPKDFNR
jgi:hypothetical protein